MREGDTAFGIAGKSIAFPRIYVEGEVIDVAEQGKKPVAYICCPYSGDVEANTRAAKRYARFAMEQGRAPLAVTLMLPQFVDEATERELALRIGEVLLLRSDEVWVCGDRISEGMQSEIRSAERQGLKILYFKEGDIRCTK